MTWVPHIDNWIIVVGMLSATACALLGCFLVLRKMSMMGDAISHSVLPGLAGGFLVVLLIQDYGWWGNIDPRHPLVMLGGAAVVGLLTTLLTEWIHGLGRVDTGAAMGVVFTTLFAVGLILIDTATADHRVDLDPSCVLYGAIETTPLDTVTLLGMTMPRAAAVLGFVTAVNLLFIVVLFKELRISSFDPALATTLGVNAKLMHYLLMALVAVTTVASFEAIGSILVIAMLIAPAATAHLLTDRLGPMLIVAVVVGVVSAVVGHVVAITVPPLFGFRDMTTAGSIATVAGLLFAVVWLIAPRHGYLSRKWRQVALGLQIVREDVLGMLYRLEESTGQAVTVERSKLQAALDAPTWRLNRALAYLRRTKEIDAGRRGIGLTDRGRVAATSLLRSHRLWETYLADQMQLPVDHLHAPAERLEHVTTREMQAALDEAAAKPETDPQGKSIPPGSSSPD